MPVRMTSLASLPAQNLLPFPQSVTVESGSRGDGRRQWNRGDQPQRTDQRAHDLFGHEGEVDQVAELSTSEREHQQHG